MAMKRIRQDGVEYEFTPGKEGSLFVRGSQKPRGIDPVRKRAKVLVREKDFSGKKYTLTRVNGKEVYGYR